MAAANPRILKHIQKPGEEGDGAVQARSVKILRGKPRSQKTGRRAKENCKGKKSHALPVRQIAGPTSGIHRARDVYGRPFT